jgi:hypothetical protein
MNKKTIFVKRLTRSPQTDLSDDLLLSPGVNVIVGRGNTGKTKWLQMLDYLMGDKSNPEDAFGELAEKYDAILALISIDGTEFEIERRWKQPGVKGKVFVDGDPIDSEDFQRFLLEKLNIPLVHFPKGNPYEERTWPELSWRIMLRQMYRQQRFWGDIADKQPESEQHACIMQFLGIAQYLFSEKSGELVQKRKQIWKLQGAREQYLSMLDEISREITDEKEIRVALTADSLDIAIARIQDEISAIQIRRDESLAKVRAQVGNQTDESDNGKSSLDRLGEDWTRLQAEKDECTNWLSKTDNRLSELQEYKSSLGSEMFRLERAKIAGSVFDGLKVTHCPVCDQAVDQNRKIDGHCFLCGQDWTPSIESDNNRLDLEITRLQEDQQEANELIKQLGGEMNERRKSLQRIEEEIELTDNRLSPIRKAVASILPPDLTIYDMEIGRLQEKARQLERIKATLSHYKALSDDIDRLKKEEEELKLIVDLESQKIHFELSAETLTEGMNTYLNKLVAAGNKLWSLPGVFANLKEKSFKFTVGGENWSTKLGGTLALYFLLSYHYGLLRLTTELESNYPGFMILDFPPTMEDGSTIRDKENFIIEPFVGLMKMPGMEATQAIITGAAFEDLQGVNRIELTKVWK